MRILTTRAIAAAAAAAIALSTMTIQPAAAGSRHGSDAAALAAFAAFFGTVAAIIAAEQERDSYAYSPGPPSGGPVYGYAPRGHYRHWHPHRHPYWPHR
jgi:hypothetical protein